METTGCNKMEQLGVLQQQSQQAKVQRMSRTKYAEAIDCTLIEFNIEGDAVAERIGTSKGNFSKYRNGKLSFQIDTLSKIISTFDRQAQSFFFTKIRELTIKEHGRYTLSEKDINCSVSLSSMENAIVPQSTSILALALVQVLQAYQIPELRCHGRGSKGRITRGKILKWIAASYESSIRVISLEDILNALTVQQELLYWSLVSAHYFEPNKNN
jgi:transcriptional regulator with XRE-family HTH domain